MSISDILSFWSPLSLKYWRRYINFKIWFIWLPGDVINDVMSIYLYNCSHKLMIPMHRKFDDDIFAHFLVIMKKCCYFIYKGKERADFEATLWCHRCRHHHENTFFDIIWGDLFISEVKLKLCLIFQNFQNSRHCDLATNFFTGSYTGSWIYQKDGHEHFRHFELLIDAVAQILTEIYQFKNLTYFVILWRHQWRDECAKHNLHN